MSSKLTTGGLTFLQMTLPGLAPQYTFHDADAAQDLRPDHKPLQSLNHQQAELGWAGEMSQLRKRLSVSMRT